MRKLFFLIPLIFLLLVVNISMAATFTVNSTVDAVDVNPGDGICETAPGNGVCTLRAAIMEHNALGGTNTIILRKGLYTLTIPGANEDVSAAGDLDITTGTLTINGAGADTTIIDGNNLDRVFDIHAGTVELSGVTIRNGNISISNSGGGGIQIGDLGTLTLTDSTINNNSAPLGSGGGIYNNNGKLALLKCVINGNSAEDSGGGIYNHGGIATITNSMVNSNSAGSNGGGISNEYSISNDAILNVTNTTIGGNNSNYAGGIRNSRGTITMYNSVVNGNTACSFGGGMDNLAGVVSLINSTISGNVVSCGGDGGGIVNFDTLTLTNVTICSNSANDGGGIWNNGGITTLKNTIVANSIGGNCFGTISSEGHNLSSDITCGFAATGDMNNTDPLLGPLADNGGPTQTHALLLGSPAIDAADPASFPPTDQRGVSRPQGIGPDIGAYEFMSSVTVPTMTEWGMIIFMVFAGLVSIYYLRRQRTS